MDASLGSRSRTVLTPPSPLCEPSSVASTADELVALGDGDPIACADAALSAARAYNIAGDLLSAERCVSAALSKLESVGASHRLGATYKLHAMLFISQDKTSLALAAATKALGYPDLAAHDRMYVYATIAMCFHRLVDLPTGGRVMLENAWPEAQRAGDPKTLMDCASRCAGLMHDYACWAQGIPNINLLGALSPPPASFAHYLQRAQTFLTICDATFDDLSEQDRSWTLSMKAMVISLSEGWDQARPVFLKARFHAQHCPRQAMLTDLCAGTSARMAGRFDEALTFLQRARSERCLHTAMTSRCIAWEFSHVFQALGQLNAAIEELRQFEHLQTKASRVAVEWLTDDADKGRYGRSFELAAAERVVFGKVTPLPVKRAVEYIKNNPSAGSSIAQLSSQANVSKRTLQALFRQHYGISLGAFVREQRMQYANELACEGRLPIAAIASMCHYSSAANFSRDYRRRFGRAPSDVKRRNLPL